MFYRVTESYDLPDRVGFRGTRWPERPAGLEYSVFYPAVYKDLLEQLYVNSPWPFCQLYRACILPKWFRPKALVVKVESGEVPDIYPQLDKLYVSQKVRDVIEQVDSFEHQFWPVKIIDEAGESITDVPYYSLNICRHLLVEQLGLTRTTSGYGINESKLFRAFLPTIQHHDELREKIETLPLWLHVGQLDEFYVNQTLLDRLHSAGVTGIDVHSGDEWGEKTATPV